MSPVVSDNEEEVNPKIEKEYEFFGQTYIHLAWEVEQYIVNVPEIKSRPNGELYVPHLIPHLFPYTEVKEVTPNYIVMTVLPENEGVLMNNRMQKAINEQGCIHFKRGPNSCHDRMVYQMWEWNYCVRQLAPLKLQVANRWAKLYYEDEQLPAPNMNEHAPWVKDMAHNDKYRKGAFQGVKILKSFEISEDDRRKLAHISITYGEGHWTVEDMVQKFISVNNLLFSYQYFVNKDKEPGYLMACHNRLMLARSGYRLLRADSKKATEVTRGTIDKTTTLWFVLNHYKLLLRCFSGRRENRITTYLSYNLGNGNPSHFMCLVDPVERDDIVCFPNLRQKRKPKYTKCKSKEKFTKKKVMINDESASKAFKNPNNFNIRRHEAQGLGDTVSSLVSGLINFKKAYSDGDAIPHVAKIVGDNGGNEFISAIIINYLKSIPDMMLKKLKGLAAGTIGVLGKIRDMIRDTFQGLIELVKGIFQPFFETSKWETVTNWLSFWNTDSGDQSRVALKTVFVVALCLFLLFVGHLFKSAVLSPLLFLAITSISMFSGALNSARTTDLWSKVYPTIGAHEAQGLSLDAVKNIATLAIGLVTLRDTSMIITLMQKMPDVTKSVSSWTCWLVDKCWIFFTDKPFFIETEQIDELKVYCDRLVEFYRNPENKRLMLTSEPLGREVRRMGRLAPGWKTAIAQLRGLDSHWYNHIVSLMNNIIVDAELVRTTGIAVTQRVEPTVLFLHGMGGQGKGASMQLFPKAIYEVVQKMLPQVFPEPWNPTMNYVRARNSDFWEGYDQNFCVTNDEMLAVSDPVSRGEECAEFLNIVDTNPMSLNMAFGQKGQNYFTSKLVIVSTNVKDDEIKTVCGMTSPPSFFRRKHINVTVTRNEKVDDVLANSSYQRAWHYKEYYDKEEGSMQHLAMQDQTVELCPHGQLCRDSSCKERHVETYFDLLKRKGVITSTFKEIAYRAAMEIVRKYKMTDSLRRRLATHEFFPEIQRVDSIPDLPIQDVKPMVDGTVRYTVIPATAPAAVAIESVLPFVEKTLPKAVIINRLGKPVDSHDEYDKLCEQDVECKKPACQYNHTSIKNSSGVGLPVYEEKIKCITWDCGTYIRPDMGVRTCPVCWRKYNTPQTTSVEVLPEISLPLPEFYAVSKMCDYFPTSDSFKPKKKDNGAGVGHVAQGFEDYQARKNEMIMDDEKRICFIHNMQKLVLVDEVANDDVQEALPARFGTHLFSWLCPSLFGHVNRFDNHKDRHHYKTNAIMCHGSVTQVSEHLENNVYELHGAKDDDTWDAKFVCKMFSQCYSPDYKIRNKLYNFLLVVLLIKKLKRHLSKEEFATLENHMDYAKYGKHMKFLREFGPGLSGRVLQEIFSDNYVIMYFFDLYFEAKYEKSIPISEVFLTSEFGHWKARFDMVMNKKKLVFNPDLSFRQWILLLEQWRTSIKYRFPNTRSFEKAQWLKKTGSLSEWISSQFYLTKWKVISVAIGTLLAAGIAWYFARTPVSLFEGDSNQINFSSAFLSDSEVAQHDPQSLSKGFQARLKARTRARAAHVAQGVEPISDSVMNQINNISNNMRTLVFHYGDHEQETPALFSGRRAFLYHHFFLVMGMGFDKITVKNDKGVTDVIHSSQVKITMPSTDKDCAYVDFSHTVFCELPSLKKQFESRQHIKDAIQSGLYKVSRLHRLVKGGTVVNYLAGGSKLVEPDAPSQCSLTTMDGSSITQCVTDYLYCVGAKGEAGHCSTPYVAYDVVTNNVYVIGFHIGRVGDDSLINVLTEEDLPRVLAYEAQGKFVYQQGLYMPPHVMDNMTSVRRQEYNGRLVSMGSLKKPSVIPSETNIIPSPFQGNVEIPPIYPVSTAPALLKKTVVEQEDGSVKEVQPLQNAIAKVVSAPVTMIDPKFIKFMENEPEAAFQGFFPNVRKEFKMLSKFEAIERLDMQASISYWGKVRGFTKREQFINKEIGWIHPDLDTAIDKTFHKMDKGYTLKQAMEACLKDETRDLPRVYAGKTRLFYVGCIVHLIVTIMIMGDIIDFMKAHRGTSDVCIGINPHGNEWELLRKKLLSIPDALFWAGDFSNFDTSIRQVFAYGLYIAVRWYVQWTDPVKNWYLYCITMSSVGPLLIITCEVYFMNYANGSGQWMTGFLNSFGNCTMNNWFYRCMIDTDFKISKPELHFDLLTSVRKYLSRNFYGDDNSGSVHPVLKGHFTMPRMSKFILENFGMTYTTPGKGTCTTDYLEWDEIDFLCRKIEHNHGTHAPLSLESIHGMVLWIRKPQRGVSIEQQLAINVEQACMEFYHYGRDVFEKEKLHLWTYCKKFNVPFTGKTYAEYHQRFADGILYC